jgi:hypothetical protein
MQRQRDRFTRDSFGRGKIAHPIAVAPSQRGQVERLVRYTGADAAASSFAEFLA